MPAADDQSNTNMIVRNTGGAIARPDCVGNPYAGQTNQNFFNLNAFALPPTNAGRFGSCGVGILQGPGMIDVNAGLAKIFKIRERARVRFEATFHQRFESHQFRAARVERRQPLQFRDPASRAAARKWRQSYGTTRIAVRLLRNSPAQRSLGRLDLARFLSRLEGRPGPVPASEEAGRRPARH